MNLAYVTQPVQKLTAAAVVVGIFKDEPLAGSAAEVDGILGGSISRLIADEEISATFGDLATMLAPAGMATKRLIVVGLGERSKFDRGRAFRAAATAAKAIAGKQREQVAFLWGEGWDPSWVEAAICGAWVGCVGQDLYRAERKLFPIRELLWSKAPAEVVQNGWILAEAINLARRLVNEPAGEVYPESFAAIAQRAAADSGFQAEVWDEVRLQNEGCEALLAVGKASTRAPRMVLMKYEGAGAGKPTLALVGKGVTFDSGGLSIKDSENMKTMKCDMAGAAAVLGAMQAIARMKLPINVIGLCGLVENMVAGNAFKLGDVLRARSGKTIEVLNTDAEGRLVLADVLNVAIERGASKIIDLATLTGACMVALGRDVTGVMTNEQSWCDEVLAAARATGEPAWQLPMFPEYAEHIKSPVADIKNIGDGRWGGAITAGKFLEEFVGDTPWVHCDIAGPAFLDSAKPWMDAGGSGVFVRTLVELARRWE